MGPKIDRADGSEEPVGLANGVRAPRGPKRFGWDTYEAIAELTGRPLRTVMQDARPRMVNKKPQAAKYDPAKLDSVLRYALRCGWPFAKGRRADARDCTE